MQKVYIKFPKTGLGNMLLVWARGVAFAKLNNLSYGTSSWWGLRWGALIRREQKKTRPKTNRSAGFRGLDAGYAGAHDQ